MREHIGIFRGFSPNEKGNSEVFINGKRIKGKWVQGFYSIDTICGGYGEKLVSVIREVPQKVYDGAWFEVLPETVGECTGLTDENGKLIFEGDVFIFDEDKTLDEEAFIVEWNDNFSGLALRFFGQFPVTRHKKSKVQKEIAKYTGWEVLADNDLSKYQIITNIYEHPELLGGEQDV